MKLLNDLYWGADYTAEHAYWREPSRIYPRLDWLFIWSVERCARLGHHADRGACPDLICRLTSWLENWLWYGGNAMW